MFKKSQISAFIILGLILIISTGLILYVNSNDKKTTEDIKQTEIAKGDEAAVKQFTQSCINNLIDEGLILYGVDKIDNYIEDNLKDCTDFKDIKSLNVEEGKVLSQATLSEDGKILSVKVNYPLIVSSGNSVITISDFIVKYEMPKTINIPLEEGKVSRDIKISSRDSKSMLEIPKGVEIKDKDGNPLDSITIIIKENNAADHIPLATHVIYQFTPEGATFDPPIKISIRYDESLIREGFNERDIRVATTSDGTYWTFLISDVDPLTNTVSSEITHFSDYSAGFVFQFGRNYFFNYEQADAFCVDLCKSKYGNKESISGYSTDNGCRAEDTYHCNEEDIRCQCLKIESCSDTDNQSNSYLGYYHKGRTSATISFLNSDGTTEQTKSFEVEDKCNGDILLESGCKLYKGYSLYKRKKCNSGCEDGKCNGDGSNSGKVDCSSLEKEHCILEGGHCDWVESEKKCMPSCGGWLALKGYNDIGEGCFEKKPESSNCGKNVAYEAYSQQSPKCTYCCQNYKKTECESIIDKDTCNSITPEGKCKWVESKNRCMPSCGTWLEKQSYNDLGGGCLAQKPDNTRCGKEISYEAFSGSGTACTYCCENPDRLEFAEGQYNINELGRTENPIHGLGYFKKKKEVVAGVLKNNADKIYLYSTDGESVFKHEVDINKDDIESIGWIFSKEGKLYAIPQSAPGKGSIGYELLEIYRVSKKETILNYGAAESGFGQKEGNTGRIFRGWGKTGENKGYLEEKTEDGWIKIAEFENGYPTGVGIFPGENIIYVSVAYSESEIVIHRLTPSGNNEYSLSSVEDSDKYSIAGEIRGFKGKIFLFGGKSFYVLTKGGDTKKIESDNEIKGIITSIAPHPVTGRIIIVSEEQGKPLQLFEYNEKENKIKEFYSSINYGGFLGRLSVLEDKNTLILGTKIASDERKNGQGVLLRIDPAQRGSGTGTGGSNHGSGVSQQAIDFCASYGSQYIPREKLILDWVNDAKANGLDYPDEAWNWLGCESQDAAADWCDNARRDKSGACSHFCVNKNKGNRDHGLKCYTGERPAQGEDACGSPPPHPLCCGGKGCTDPDNPRETGSISNPRPLSYN